MTFDIADYDVLPKIRGAFKVKYVPILYAESHPDTNTVGFGSYMSKEAL